MISVQAAIPGDKRALNKGVVEALANQVHVVELRGEPEKRVWAYRRAAWAIEDREQVLGLIYRATGRKGLESIENVGLRLAEVVEDLLKERGDYSVGPERESGCITWVSSDLNCRPDCPLKLVVLWLRFGIIQFRRCHAESIPGNRGG